MKNQLLKSLSSLLKYENEPVSIALRSITFDKDPHTGAESKYFSEISTNLQKLKCDVFVNKQLSNNDVEFLDAIALVWDTNYPTSPEILAAEKEFFASIPDKIPVVAFVRLQQHSSPSDKDVMTTLRNGSRLGLNIQRTLENLIMESELLAQHFIVNLSKKASVSEEKLRKTIFNLGKLARKIRKYHESNVSVRRISNRQEEEGDERLGSVGIEENSKFSVPSPDPVLKETKSSISLFVDDTIESARQIVEDEKPHIKLRRKRRIIRTNLTKIPEEQPTLSPKLSTIPTAVAVREFMEHILLAEKSLDNGLYFWKMPSEGEDLVDQVFSESNDGRLVYRMQEPIQRDLVSVMLEKLNAREG